MSRSSQELVKHKIKNPVYSEILIKLNTREVYLYDFVKEFKKARPTLLKQIQELEEEGFIKRKIIKERNKQIFFINWNKIIKEFWSYCKSIKPNLKIKEEFYKNPYFIFYFQELFKSYNNKRVFPTIENMFKNTIFSLIDTIVSDERKDIGKLFNFLHNYHYTDDLYYNFSGEIGETINKKIYKNNLTR